MKLKERQFGIMLGVFLLLLMSISSIYLMNQKNILFFFSLAAGVNPFDQEAKAEIT